MPISPFWNSQSLISKILLFEKYAMNGRTEIEENVCLLFCYQSLCMYGMYQQNYRLKNGFVTSRLHELNSMYLTFYPARLHSAQTAHAFFFFFLINETFKFSKNRPIICSIHLLELNNIFMC